MPDPHALDPIDDLHSEDIGGYCTTCGGLFPCLTRKLARDLLRTSRDAGITEGLRRAADVGRAVEHLNRPMVDRLRRCAADTTPNWDGAVTVYPLETRGLVALIDAALALGGPEPVEQPEATPEQSQARDVAGELLTILAAAIRRDVASGTDDADRLLLAEIFEAAHPLVGNPVARPLVLPVAKLAQRMYAVATAEQPEGGA